LDLFRLSFRDFVRIVKEFHSIPDAPSEVIYPFIQRTFLEHTDADAIYILASNLDTLGIVATLEQDLGVRVVQPIAARIWEIQRGLHVRQPIAIFRVTAIAVDGGATPGFY
jgi:maleate cis-trans isomerase